jgi:hypothetical protein
MYRWQLEFPSVLSVPLDQHNGSKTGLEDKTVCWIKWKSKKNHLRRQQCSDISFCKIKHVTKTYIKMWTEATLDSSDNRQYLHIFFLVAQNVFPWTHAIKRIRPENGLNIRYHLPMFTRWAESAARLIRFGSNLELGLKMTTESSVPQQEPAWERPSPVPPAAPSIAGGFKGTTLLLAWRSVFASLLWRALLLFINILEASQALKKKAT